MNRGTQKIQNKNGGTTCLGWDKGILISWSGAKVLVLHPLPVLEEAGILHMHGGVIHRGSWTQ